MRSAKAGKGAEAIMAAPGRIVTDLNEQGIRCGRKRVMRSMKRMGLQGRCNRRRSPRTRTRTTDSVHNNRISANLLKHRAFPDKPRQVLVSDTTYVRTDQGWHYLATVMDLCTREILGWSFSNHNDQQLVCRALWKAADKLGPLIGEGIHHSDRGSTYTSDAYLQTLEDLKLSSSMSAKGYCYDNTHMESFFGSLKTQCAQLDEDNSPEGTRLACCCSIISKSSTTLIAFTPPWGRVHANLCKPQAATEMGAHWIAAPNPPLGEQNEE